MVRHVIIWDLKEELSPEEKTQRKLLIKQGLESLKDKIDGIISIRVETELLDSSNGSLMLDSTFENEQALKNYSVHPEHLKVANNIVRPYVSQRKCADFEIK